MALRLNQLGACLRRELRLQIMSPAHVVILVLLPLVLVLLLTTALQNAYAPGVGADTKVPVHSDAILRTWLARRVDVEATSEAELRALVRDGRRFLGVVGTSDPEAEGAGITVVADPAFPEAAKRFAVRLQDLGGGEIRVEDARGRPLDLQRPFGAFNYTVPGLAIMFLFFLGAYTGYTVYGDVVTGAWMRLRASEVPGWVTVASKVTGAVAVGVLQLTIVLGVGRLALGLRIQPADVAGLLVVGVAISFVAASLGVLLTGLTRTAQVMTALNNLCVVLLAGLGGALAPLAALPNGVQAIARFTPHYWALAGVRDVLYRDLGFGQLARDLVPLALMGAVFLFVGLRLLRHSKLSPLLS